ncbi:hypothetical protein JCM5353_008358 [Sporobolomyces roseus]
MAPSSLSTPLITSSDKPPLTPPATSTSFLSFSPSPPVPSRIQALAPPIDLASPISAQSTTSFDLDQELALSPDFSTTNFASKNPFLAILIAQRAQLSSPTPSSASSLSSSQSTPSTSTSEASSSISDLERSEREKREERDSVVIYDGSIVRSGGFSSMLDDIMTKEMKEWEEDTESAWEEELYSSWEKAISNEVNLAEDPPLSPTTPIQVFATSPPPTSFINTTPRAQRLQPKIHHSPSPRRKSAIVIKSSPRSKHPSRILRSPNSSSVARSRRASLLPIDGFAHFPTSPINLSTTSPSHFRSCHHFITSPSHLSPQKAKSTSKSRSKKSPRSAPPLRPIRKTAEGFDADALDQLFGVPCERRGKNKLIVEGEEEEWRKVEEFRGLLEEGNPFETEPESEEEEVLHIRAPLTRSRMQRKKEKNRPPPLNLGVHPNSFGPQLPPSSFSTNTANLDAPICLAPPCVLVHPVLKEIERRKNGAKEGKRILRGKKSVGERLRSICGIAT